MKFFVISSKIVPVIGKIQLDDGILEIRVCKRKQTTHLF